MYTLLWKMDENTNITYKQIFVSREKINCKYIKWNGNVGCTKLANPKIHRENISH